MSIGAKMQRAYGKAYRKTGQQEGDLIIRQKNSTRSTIPGGPLTNISSSDVIIHNGCKVTLAQPYEFTRDGKIKLNDMRFTVPGNLVSEQQLTNAVLIYKGKEYSIQQKGPTEVYSGLPVEWRIYGRAEG